MTASIESNYLQQQLLLNPLDQAQDIIATRQRFLRRNTQPVESAAQINESEERNRILKQIEQIRAQFWSLDKTGLQQQLETIDVSAYPDLAVSITRMQQVASLRKSFQRLEQNPACFPDFYEQFCSLVIAPPRTAGELRARYLDEIRHPTNPNAPSLKSYRRVISAIELEYPELKAMERLLLNQITMRPKPRKMRSETLEILFLGSIFCFAASILASFLLLILAIQ
ncbi:hypothetical protein [uncultured Gimesia sp.]|uniref:hypothetical protein n=1 Tax=uncultured Gimesia sp. TaxID=1678688 RepID=UPI0030DC50AE|tara:strand:- start:48369 stop:49046 length:678 start_codon:yes stop_codon:yes gene_type:complete